MKTIKELFLHDIKGVYSAEHQLIESTPELMDYASDCGLKNTFKTLLHDVKKHKSRLETICKNLNLSPSGETCLGVKGLILETKNLVKVAKDRNILDAGLLANAQRVAYFEIATYTTLVRYARELQYTSAAASLQKCLEEAYDAVRTLDNLAENRLNEKVIAI